MKSSFPKISANPFAKNAFPALNWVITFSMVLLLVFGVFFIRSASATRTGEVRFLHLRMLYQWIPLGLLLHALVARSNYRKWNDWSWVFYVVGILMLILLFVPGVGTERMGARRWLFGFQPSEFVKFAVIPMLAFILSGSPLRKGPVKFFLVLLATAIPAALIALQPDLGTALPLVPVALAMAFVSGCAPRTLALACLVGLLLAGSFFAAVLLPEQLPPEPRARVEQVVDKVIFPHWKKRILVFVHPERDPLGAGWNKRQSEIAVGSGGLHGKGYLKGTQNILGFLPRAVSSTDFIFSVIGEEKGFYGSAVLLALFAGLLGGIAVTGLTCRDEVGRLICTGVAALLFTHIFVNVAMTIGKMPITGIPLPLVSYGGSFTLSTLALLGLVQSIAIHGRKPISGSSGP